MFIPTKVQFNLTYDIVFKEVFSDVKIASNLINVILNESFLPSDFKVMANELSSESIELKNSLFDVRLNVLNKYDIDLEMQKDKPYKYSLIDRIIFYNAKMIAKSIEEGDSTYRGKTCISVVFINFELKGYNKCVNTISYTDEEGREISKHKIYLIDLTKSDQCDNLKLKKWLELIKSEELNSFEGEDEVMSEVVKKVFTVNADERLRAKLLSQEKFMRDRQIELAAVKEDARAEGLQEGRAQGREEGRAQGLQEGKAQGREEGKVEGILEVARNMKAKNMPIDQIVELTSLSVDEINKL